MSPERISILSPIKRNPGLSHGGITPVVLTLAQGFTDRGLSVDLLGFAPEARFRELQGVPESVRWVDLGKGSKWSNSWLLQKFLRNERPDILLSCGWRANHVAARARRFTNGPTRFWGSLHNAVSPSLAQMGIWRRRKNVSAMRKTFLKLDGFIAVAQGTADDFARVAGLDASAMEIVYNPIFRQEILDLADAPLDHPWFAPGQPPVVLAVGRLTEQKDFPCLLRAFVFLRKKTPCRLMILGEGNERKALEALVAELGMNDSVDFTGFVSNPFCYMKHASLFVLSSAWEGFGNVLVEAMAVGTPVVSTDCPSGPREILDDGRYGPLVPVGDSQALSSAMFSALENPVEESSLKKRAAVFNVERCVERYLDIFRREGRRHA